MIKIYQREEPSKKDKYTTSTYQNVSFCGGTNIDLKLISCKDNIIIPSKLQRYVVHWYYTYIHHPGMDRTEAIIRQRLYWHGIIDAVQKEVPNCDTCKRTKWSNTKYGKLPYKLAEEILWNKICVDLIGPYVIRRKGKKENLHLKSITMIDTVTGWFEVLRYDD